MFTSPQFLSVLAIEDSRADIFLIQEAFRQCGANCNLTIVPNGQEAWSLLNSQQIDVIITHSGNGLDEIAEFIRQIRVHPRTNAMPVVLLSGRYEVNAAYAAGVNVFIRKSMDLDVLFEKIKVLVHFWLHIAERPESRPTKPLSSAQRQQGPVLKRTLPSPPGFCRNDLALMNKTMWK